MNTETGMDLGQIRAQLDRIDGQMTALFAERMETVARIAAWKEARGLPTLDAGREREILDRVAQAAGPRFAYDARRLYRTLLSGSRGFQAVRRDSRSLVLVGMPGSGKTTLGRLAAAWLDRPFADMDEEIERESGRTIPQLFAEEGEEAFRDREAAAAARLANLRGAVIATGGGTVLRPGNTEALRRDSVVVWITRPLERLSMDGRPLSMGIDALRQMAAVRTPLYAACADARAANDGTVAEGAERLLDAFRSVVCGEG